MSIIKSKQSSNYTVMPNDVFTVGLSIEAIGLLAYFLSLPHDWVIYKTKLHDQLGIGREKLDRIFKELQDSGFILSVKRQQQNGRFEHEHVVYDRPFNGEPEHGEPDTGLPEVVLPDMANQPLLNTKLLSTKETKETKKKKIYTNFDFFTHLVEMGVRVQVAQDWLQVRKEKKASNTETAWALFLSEVGKSGMTVEQCVMVCVEHSWKGFKAEWVGSTSNNQVFESKFKDESW